MEDNLFYNIFQKKNLLKNNELILLDKQLID